MKNSLIEQIFDLFDNGKVTKERQYLLEAADDLELRLEKLLPNELIELKDSLLDAITQSCCQENKDYFALGFKLGLKLGMECNS